MYVYISHNAEDQYIVIVAILPALLWLTNSYILKLW